ncbi:OLC1v1031800C1 [Oldenlandia corymbosa var. corymbosa]|uniref:OLC1v1031800C1 n=1 Tax=Oldenlandia corymbosa var. corymbosa TaxID=529605 RepID=A0AAV1CJR2_OLDCO|nr:OLC1v1031800C1 [Oldenlandia corymbosa var. corymbosa]
MYNVFSLIFLLALVPANSIRLTEITSDQNYGTWQKFTRFVDTEKGSQVKGLSDLKVYLQFFGYLSNDPTKNLTDLYDEEMESAVSAYQKNMGLPVSGELDNDTMNLIIAPRCGNPDKIIVSTNNSIASILHYSFLKNTPMWKRQIPITLKYAFSPDHMIPELSVSEIRPVFERAFERWSSATSINFAETDDLRHADISIGFYTGNHGDTLPFDGPLGMTAHAYPPETGIIHLDGAEIWAVDSEKLKLKRAVDLESVALHEIGHVLGLGHSTINEAVMYPTLISGTRKVELSVDDVEGIQGLYGSNRSKHDFQNSSWSTLQGLRRSSGSSMILGIMVFLVYLRLL